MGAALGALTLAHGGVAGLGWVAAACELAAVLLTLAIVGRPAVLNAPCQAERG
jgi:predicted MFS family arabinose efflux permease